MAKKEPIILPSRDLNELYQIREQVLKTSLSLGKLIKALTSWERIYRILFPYGVISSERPQFSALVSVLSLNLAIPAMRATLQAFHNVLGRVIHTLEKGEFYEEEPTIRQVVVGGSKRSGSQKRARS